MGVLSMSKYVVEIPQDEQAGSIWVQRLRVATYCRVSTKHEEQQNSLKNQIEFYNDYLQRNPYCRLLRQRIGSADEQAPRLSAITQRLWTLKNRFGHSQIPLYQVGTKKF